MTCIRPAVIALLALAPVIGSCSAPERSADVHVGLELLDTCDTPTSPPNGCGPTQVPLLEGTAVRVRVRAGIGDPRCADASAAAPDPSGETSTVRSATLKAHVYVQGGGLPGSSSAATAGTSDTDLTLTFDGSGCFSGVTTLIASNAFDATSPAPGRFTIHAEVSGTDAAASASMPLPQVALALRGSKTVCVETSAATGTVDFTSDDPALVAANASAALLPDACPDALLANGKGFSHALFTLSSAPTSTVHATLRGRPQNQGAHDCAASTTGPCWSASVAPAASPVYELSLPSVDAVALPGGTPDAGTSTGQPALYRARANVKIGSAPQGNVPVTFSVLASSDGNNPAATFAPPTARSDVNGDAFSLVGGTPGSFLVVSLGAGSTVSDFVISFDASGNATSSPAPLSP